jgi:hypothetical protein
LCRRAPSRRQHTTYFRTFDRPGSTTYNPTPSYANYDLGGAIAARRTAVGVYKLDIPRDAPVSTDTVLVTAYGKGDHHCKVDSWARGSTTTTITVRCFNSAGLPIDAMFNASYLTSNDL